MKYSIGIVFLFVLSLSLSFSSVAMANGEDTVCEVTATDGDCAGTTRVSTPEEFAAWDSDPTTNLIIGTQGGGMVVVAEEIEIETECSVTVAKGTTLPTEGFSVQASAVAINGHLLGVSGSEETFSVEIDTLYFSSGQHGGVYGVGEMTVRTNNSDIHGNIRGLTAGGEEEPDLTICTEENLNIGSSNSNAGKVHITQFEEVNIVAVNQLKVQRTFMFNEEIGFVAGN